MVVLKSCVFFLVIFMVSVCHIFVNGIYIDKKKKLYFNISEVVKSGWQ